MLLILLLALTLALSAADHWTTYLCLRAPVEGYLVSEANPIAHWLFSEFGLVAGLAIDSVATAGGMLFLATTTRVPHAAKLAFLAALVLGTGYTVANNLQAVSHLGLAISG